MCSPSFGARAGCADLALGADGASHLAQAAELGMLHLDDHLARQHLLVGERLAHVVDGRARHAAAQPLEPLRGGARREALLERRPPASPGWRGGRGR